MSIDHKVTVPISEGASYIEDAINAGRVACLWGKPGIGKTAIVEQVAAKLGRKLFVLIASTREPTDILMEMYVANDGTVKFRDPEFATYTDPAILFLDELNRGAVQTQNALLRPINEKKLGNKPLPTNLAIVAACNYETDGGGVGKMMSAMSGRVDHMDFIVTLDGWSLWAYANGIAPVVIAYNRFRRGDSLHRFNPIERACPSPRTWHMLSDLYKQNLPLERMRVHAVGTVGEEEGVGFMAFESLYRKMQAVNVDAIVLNPHTANIPTDLNTIYALSAALADMMDVNNVDNIITYMERLPVEYNVYAVKLATRHKKELEHTSSFGRWFVKHQRDF